LALYTAPFTGDLYPTYPVDLNISAHFVLRVLPGRHWSLDLNTRETLVMPHGVFTMRSGLKWQSSGSRAIQALRWYSVYMHSVVRHVSLLSAVIRLDVKTIASILRSVGLCTPSADFCSSFDTSKASSEVTFYL